MMIDYTHRHTHINEQVMTENNEDLKTLVTSGTNTIKELLRCSIEEIQPELCH